MTIFPKMGIFLFKKIVDIWKMPTEKEMIEQVRNGKLALPPLTIRLLEEGPILNGTRRFDAIVEAGWGNNTAKFVIECKTVFTPKAFETVVNLFKTIPLPRDFHPLVFLPFLSDRHLQKLEREGISGIDLCGNGIVVVPGKLFVYRSGENNRYPSSALIKNIYRRNSAMVGRVFLARPDYPTVQEILSEINRRNMLVNYWNKKAMSLSTVSKSLKTLADDLIIGRNGFIRLLQPDELLDKLKENYKPPIIKNRIRIKVKYNEQSILTFLSRQAQYLELPIIATGLSSVNQFAVMKRDNILSVYCPRLDELSKTLNANQIDRFPNLELLETEDETLFFDAQKSGDFWWASPIQVYLELMAGDKRDRETANQVRSYILSNLTADKQ